MQALERCAEAVLEGLAGAGGLEVSCADVMRLTVEAQEEPPAAALAAVRGDEQVARASPVQIIQAVHLLGRELISFSYKGKQYSSK